MNTLWVQVVLATPSFSVFTALFSSVRLLTRLCPIFKAKTCWHHIVSFNSGIHFAPVFLLNTIEGGISPVFVCYFIRKKVGCLVNTHCSSTYTTNLSSIGCLFLSNTTNRLVSPDEYTCKCYKTARVNRLECFGTNWRSPAGLDTGQTSHCWCAAEKAQAQAQLLIWFAFLFSALQDGCELWPNRFHFMLLLVTDSEEHSGWRAQVGGAAGYLAG